MSLNVASAVIFEDACVFTLEVRFVGIEVVSTAAIDVVVPVTMDIASAVTLEVLFPTTIVAVLAVTLEIVLFATLVVLDVILGIAATVTLKE